MIFGIFKIFRIYFVVIISKIIIISKVSNITNITVNNGLYFFSFLCYNNIIKLWISQFVK
ncbi:hypothetical protein A2515_04095 [Candidatus Falkowbacteria bacterium RIFOXYD12_FULL_34_57]|nr:MAG: hypothetical protein A2500_03720 [Candidatus Falkowbacteria bacterium RIFOXYC12_FULL_34_55]OGF39477.1 MAG: hypothetical protein A2515_04095 [Candidatus Falkowbacteria bacterium RIFOXYD12_FULL_34_57]